MSEAIGAVFDTTQSTEAFAQELAGLCTALVMASECHVFRAGELTPIASHPESASLPKRITDWLGQLPDAEAEPQEAHDALAIGVSLPGGGTGLLVARLKGATPATRALAFERMVGLARLSNAVFRHPDISALESVAEGLTLETDLETVASRIRALVDADMVAIAEFRNQDIVELAISDQPAAATRAGLPDALGDEFRVALDPARRASDVFVARQGSAAITLKADRARRHASLLPLLAHGISAARSDPSARRRAWNAQMVRRAAMALVAFGLAFVPVPDARRVPAEVISVETRLVTAPFSGLILEMRVSDGDVVTAGETVLAQLETEDIAQELAIAQADYSQTLLERETARGARDATTLRNAELESESLRARIDLLKARLDRATLRAPIDGVVSGNDLSSFTSATVRQGETLMSVLQPEALELRLDVQDRLLHRIDDGEAGIFRPDFAPGEGFEGRVLEISPAQSDRADAAVFQGRATLSESTETLRPGLRGVFVFDREFRPLFQIVGEAVRNWVLLRLWL
ncbi:MAG: HlyD family efflux transporter periplasmic adaptor subunit [Pseudomonadota bacterium]